MQEDTTTVNIQPDQQLIQISNQIDAVRTTLEESGETLPELSLRSLERLSKHINHLAETIAQQREKIQDFKALAEIGQVVNSSLDIDEVLRIVMDTIIRLTGAERGFLMLREESGELTIRVARNWEQEAVPETDFAISRTVVNRVTDEGVPILTTIASEDPRFEGQDSVVAYNLRSILCVPLIAKEKITGVIYADNRIRTGLFTDSERDLLADFANQAAVAIENARLFQSVRQTLAEVSELKNLMDNVFDSIASGVITTDIQNKITLCNQAAEKILARAATSLLDNDLGKSLPELAAKITDPINMARDTEQIIAGVELNPSLPKRGPVHLRLNFSPLKDAQETTYGVAIVVDDITEKKRLEAQRRLFERMVSPAVIDQLDPEEIKMGGERVEITTLFADIRSFTHYSESLTPEELVSVLNRYLGATAEAVLTQEGTIDKFMGDAVMAWFNAPIPQLDHTLRAVRSALSMRDAIQSLHQNLPPEAHLEIGVGIHFGAAVLGVVGTEKRLDYTAIGDSVNTAKRIQENAANNQILISGTAYQLVKDQISVQPTKAVHAKGKSQPIKVHEVLGIIEQ